jgi:hypothetical protein
VISHQLPVSNQQQPVILSRRRRIYLSSYPPLGGFLIFYSCAFIFYMFLQNEPIFSFSIITVSDYSTTGYCSLVTGDCRQTNPFLPLLRHTMCTPFLAQNGRFYKNLRQKAPFYTHQPSKFEPIFTPPATHDVPLDSGSKSHISPKSPAKTPISTSSHAKIRTQFNARRDTRQIF